MQVSAFAPSFEGCGGINIGELTRVEFDNYSGEPQDFCVDQVDSTLLHCTASKA